MFRPYDESIENEDNQKRLNVSAIGGSSTHNNNQLSFYKQVKFKKPSRGTVALDLDETLVHTTTDPNALGYDMKLSIRCAHSKQVIVCYVYLRPYLLQFLKQISRWYEIVIFTASQSDYADPLINSFDSCKFISRRFFRNCCKLVGNEYVKDLSMVRDDFSRVVLVDNSPMCYSMNPENAVPIKSWRGERCDTELLDLIYVSRLYVYIYN